jgi:hypothetical protein
MDRKKDEKNKQEAVMKGFCDGVQIIVYCPFCQTFHRHGWRDKSMSGQRGAHCTHDLYIRGKEIENNSPFLGKSYIVKPFTKAEVREIKNWIQAMEDFLWKS